MVVGFVGTVERAQDKDANEQGTQGEKVFSVWIHGRVKNQITAMQHVPSSTPRPDQHSARPIDISILIFIFFEP